MTTILFLHALALTFAASPAPLPPTVMPAGTRGINRVESVALHARFDPDLGSMRAGGIDAPAPFGAAERAELASAQRNSRSLEALRAGASPSDNEWKWLAIGAGVVLLIVLL